MPKLMTATTPENFESVARLFSVMADPTRLMILYLLKEQPGYVSEIVERSGLRQPNISKHLALLYDAGLVSRERNGNQIRYSIGDALVFELCKMVCGKLHRQAESQAQILRTVAG